MGFVLKVRLASFFAGAATASALGFYFLHKDYKMAHGAISQQVGGLYDSLDERISKLENLKDMERATRLEATD